MAYGGKGFQEPVIERAKRPKEAERSQEQVRRIAQACAAHAAERSSDPIERLMALHELSAALEKELAPAVRKFEPSTQYDDYEPEEIVEPGIEADYTFEMLFLPVGRVLGAGAKVLGRGWTFMKLSRPFRAAITGYEKIVGPMVERWGMSIRIPWNSKWAVQRWTPAAFRTRKAVQAGAPVYKQGSFKAGTFGGSETGASQFLANENPLLSPTYLSRHGAFSPNKDWVMRFRLKPGAKAIVRSSVPGKMGPGGAPEAVVEEYMLRIDWFHMP